MKTKTTVGQLVAILFAKYQRRYHNRGLAAVATQAALENMRGVERI